MITTETIKELRDKTGISIMQCKKALEEAGGDMEKAIIMLKKKSGEIAAKKGDRALGSGAVASYIHSTGSVGGMVVLSAETDFVAKNEEFRKLAYDIAMHVVALNPEYLSSKDIPEEAKAKARDAFRGEVKDKPAPMQEKILDGKLASYFGERTLLDQRYVKNPEITIQGLVEQAVQKFGERIEVSQFIRFSA
ncbi:MAG: elongation factor Ts [Patescibacteria group bacterium]